MKITANGSTIHKNDGTPLRSRDLAEGQQFNVDLVNMTATILPIKKKKENR